MKALTEEERVASVPMGMRRHIWKSNEAGESQKKIGKRLGIAERTIGAVMRSMTVRGRVPQPVAKHEHGSCKQWLWDNPHLWKQYGLKRPYEPSMVPVASSLRRS